MSILAPAQIPNESTIEVTAEPESLLNQSHLNPEPQCLSIEHNLSLTELAAAINNEHHLCQEGYKSSLYYARRTGVYLLQAKEQVKKSISGRWLVWLKENCPDIAERTAQAYMQVAREWEEIEKSATVADFGLKGALKLLSKRKVSMQPESTQPSIDVLDVSIDAEEAEVQTHTQPEVGNSKLKSVESSAWFVNECDRATIDNQLITINSTESRFYRNQLTPVEVNEVAQLDRECGEQILSNGIDCNSILPVANSTSTSFVNKSNPESIVLAISEIVQPSSSIMLERMDDTQLKILIDKSSLLIKKAKLLLNKRHTVQLQ